MSSTKNYDLDIDTTLGGSNASDYVIPSQKAIKTYVDNNSGGGGSSTDVQINGTSITSQGVANIITESAYNASSNKIATMSDVPNTSGLANTDLSNLSNTGNAKFQAPLISGSNIKTINNTSLLGSGDISVGSYSAGTGLSLSGTTFNHSNSVTAGTIGTSSATSGSTISVPYATYDAQGHITAKGTHTHTVTGFLTSSSSEVASSRFDGQWVCSIVESAISQTATGGYSYSLANYLPGQGTSYPYTSYPYLIYGRIALGSSNNTHLAIGRIANPYTNISAAQSFAVEAVTVSASTRSVVTFILPVGKQGNTTYSTLYAQIGSAKASSYGIVSLIGYRRIGTNS